MPNEEYWPLHKRVDELLHTLVTMHHKSPPALSPEFHVYKGPSEQFDWLEHPGIERYKNRVPMQMKDVGTLRMRRLVVLASDWRHDKTFDLTVAGVKFHDEHCTREHH